MNNLYNVKAVNEKGFAVYSTLQAAKSIAEALEYAKMYAGDLGCVTWSVEQ